MTGGIKLRVNAFNQYIDMFFKDNPKLTNNDLNIKFIREQTEPVQITCNIIFDEVIDNILVSKHPFEANNIKELHSHDYFELIYVSRGSCTQTIESRPCDMREGDICLISPNVNHHISTKNPDDLLFNIMIRPTLFQTSFTALIAENDLISNFFFKALFATSNQQQFKFFPYYENIESKHYIQKLILEFYEKKLGYSKAMECHLALLFTQLVRFHKEKLDEENFELMGNNQLSAILTYINANKAYVTLNSVAEAFNYHPNYLSALVKKYTNKSFSAFLQEAKLNEICHYLEHTDMPINEIILLCGYFDRSHFNRVFKKHYNSTPIEYRNKYRV